MAGYSSGKGIRRASSPDKGSANVIQGPAGTQGQSRKTEMSTKTTLKTALKNAKSIGMGAEEFLSELIALQEGTKDVKVTYDPKADTVRMHGSESAKVDSGVLSFSDTPYQVGFNTQKDGTVEVVYDSWVMGGKLTKRIKGRSATEMANLKQVQSLHNIKAVAARRGKRVSTYGVDGRLRAFVPA